VIARLRNTLFWNHEKFVIRQGAQFVHCRIEIKVCCTIKERRKVSVKISRKILWRATRHTRSHREAVRSLHPGPPAGGPGCGVGFLIKFYVDPGRAKKKCASHIFFSPGGSTKTFIRNTTRELSTISKPAVRSFDSQADRN
jgi:hypothetical protein